MLKPPEESLLVWFVLVSRCRGLCYHEESFFLQHHVICAMLSNFLAHMPKVCTKFGVDGLRMNVV